ncbi:hypothetical protein Pfo_021771 [Paulownia fortunei]|nr:hypothetical protein Pfo_021771 [Paulownia fortunei]
MQFWLWTLQFSRQVISFLNPYDLHIQSSFFVKMTALVRKNLPCLILKHASSVCVSHVSFSLSLHFFSTSRERQLVTSPKAFDILLHKHHFSPEVVALAASNLTRLKSPEKLIQYCHFSKRVAFLILILRIALNPKIFQDLGFSSDDIAKIISSNPLILQLNVNTRVIPSLSVLKGLLGSKDDVAKLLRKFGWFLTKDLEKTMVPNIEFLKNCGIPMERILKLLYNYPRCLLIKPEIMRKSIDKAEQMGGDRSSNMFIYTIRIIVSMSNEAWELKLQAFQNFGFSKSDILTMFRKAPSRFSGSVEKIKKTKEVLHATGKFNLSCIVNNPMSLACSIEKRYKPRLRILEILKSRNLIKNWPSLGTIYTLSDDKFFEKFISPYAKEVGEVYIRKSSVRDQRR